MENKKQIQIPSSILNSIKEAQETYKKLQDNIKSIIPKIPTIDLTKFEIPQQNYKDFVLPPNMDIVQEENNWIRHNEVLQTQNTLLNVFKEVLKEQQSTSKMTMIIIALTIFGIITTVILSIFF
jgi:hypothetical protein